VTNKKIRNLMLVIKGVKINRNMIETKPLDMTNLIKMMQALITIIIILNMKVEMIMEILSMTKISSIIPIIIILLKTLAIIMLQIIHITATPIIMQITLIIIKINHINPRISFKKNSLTKNTINLNQEAEPNPNPNKNKVNPPDPVQEVRIIILIMQPAILITNNCIFLTKILIKIVINFLKNYIN
jgi:hypothetical protein